MPIGGGGASVVPGFRKSSARGCRSRPIPAPAPAAPAPAASTAAPRASAIAKSCSSRLTSNSGVGIGSGGGPVIGSQATTKSAVLPAAAHLAGEQRQHPQRAGQHVGARRQRREEPGERQQRQPADRQVEPFGPVLAALAGEPPGQHQQQQRKSRATPSGRRHGRNRPSPAWPASAGWRRAKNCAT